jgi:hypothetical protein
MQIQNATSIKILRVCEGEMGVLHDYIRGQSFSILYGS